MKKTINNLIKKIKDINNKEMQVTDKENNELLNQAKTTKEELLDTNNRSGIAARLKEVCFNSIQSWIFRCFIVALFLEFVLEILGRRSISLGLNFLFKSPKVFIYNVVIIFFTLLFALLFRKRIFMLGLISILWLTCGVVNYVLLGYRVTPFTALEVTMFRDMLGMMTVYYNTNQIILIFCLISIGIGLLVFMFIKSPKFQGKRHVIRTMLLCFCTFIVLNIFTEYGVKHNIISDDFSNLGMAYEDYGFAYCFSNSLIDVGINEPEGYSKEYMLELKNVLDQYEVAGSKKTPNIIIIQLESFIDVKRVKGLELSKDPVPNFTKLKQNDPSGLFTVPSIGAGTANTEFEVGSGMKTSYFGAGEYPYKTILTSQPCESIARILKKQGYTNHAIHNHKGAFYERDTAFSNLGFDTFTSLEYMYDVEETARGWAKDYVLTDEIMKALNSTDGQDYIFTISVQGHGKYPTDYKDEYEKHVDVKYEEDDKLEAAFSYFTNQIYEMDEMIGELIDTLDESGEDYVLFMYGDHLPSLDLTEEKLNSGGLFQTEYVMHSNIDFGVGDKDMASYNVGNYLLDLLNLDYGYIQKAYAVYGHFDNFDEILNMLQYDMLYGEKYILEDNEYVASNLKMGIDEISIVSIERDTSVVDQNNYIIKGDNFNSYSTVIVNDNRIETEYVNKHTLIVKDMELEDGDNIAVGQVNSNKNIMSFSNSIVYIDKSLDN